MEVINPYTLMVVAVVLLILEVFTLTAFLLFFAIGFGVAGVSSLFIEGITGNEQIFAIIVGTSVSALLIKKSIFKKYNGDREMDLQGLKEGGIGQVVEDSQGNKLISYKGTTWRVINHEEIGDSKEVIVKEIKENKVIIKQK